MRVEKVKKIDAFFLDDDYEKADLERILNNPRCHIFRKETIKIKESESEIDGNRRSEFTRDRLKMLIEYEIEKLV